MDYRLVIQQIRSAMSLNAVKKEVRKNIDAEVIQLKESVVKILSHSFFSEVSNPAPLFNPV